MMLSLTNALSPFFPLLLEPSIPSRRSLPLISHLSSYLYSSQSPVLSLRSSKRNSSLCAYSKSELEGVWEEPDDGFDSEYEEDEIEAQEEEEEEEEENQNSCSETGVTGSSYEEDLMREVEQLLTPEEKAILDMNKNPDLSKISTSKWNPLHTFALAIQIPQMDKLVESGIDINSVDKDGATPLHYAVQVGAMQTVKLLIKYKVDVNVADNEGWTPLHLAILGRNPGIAKVLLVNGADSTRRNKDGKTALDLSLCYGKDFKSYDLAKLVKLVPANRDP